MELMLQDALSRSAGLKIPEGKFYLADAGYAARPGILPPYRGVRYHLNEFAGSREPNTPKELFNHRHSSLRTTVERAFGTLKNRFKILSHKPFIPLKSQIKVVVACCALHNWILENGPDEWGWVRRAMQNSGNGFDSTLCKFTLSESEKANLSKTAVNYLTRPIRFYHLLEELFSDQSQADGSLAADQTTVNVPDDSDDNDGIQEIDGYNFTADTDEDADSDTIARHSPKTDLDGKPASKKRKCEKSNSKNAAKAKVSTTDVAASIVMLAGSLSKPPPPPPVPMQHVVPADPYANLWKRINDLTITSKDKLVIVDHLSKPDQAVLRSYLNCSPDSMLHEWIMSFFEQAGGTGPAF